MTSAEHQEFLDKASEAVLIRLREFIRSGPERLFATDISFPEAGRDPSPSTEVTFTLTSSVVLFMPHFSSAPESKTSGLPGTLSMSLSLLWKTERDDINLQRKTLNIHARKKLGMNQAMISPISLPGIRGLEGTLINRLVMRVPHQ